MKVLIYPQTYGLSTFGSSDLNKCSSNKFLSVFRPLDGSKSFKSYSQDIILLIQSAERLVTSLSFFVNVYKVIWPSDTKAEDNPQN